MNYKYYDETTIPNEVNLVHSYSYTTSLAVSVELGSALPVMNVTDTVKQANREGREEGEDDIEQRDGERGCEKLMY